MQKYIIHHFEEESDCLHWNIIEVVDRSKQNLHVFLAFAFPKPCVVACCTYFTEKNYTKIDIKFIQIYGPWYSSIAVSRRWKYSGL